MSSSISSDWDYPSSLYNPSTVLGDMPLDQVSEDSMLESFVALVPSTSAEQGVTSGQQPNLGFNFFLASAFGPAENIMYDSHENLDETQDEDPDENSFAFNWLLWQTEPSYLSATPGSEMTLEALAASEADHGMKNVYNLDLRELFESWGNVYDRQMSGYLSNTQSFPPINSQAARLYVPTNVKVSINDLDDKRCDFQGIDWPVLGATRQATREMRKKTYKNHTGILPRDNYLPSLSALQSLNVSMRGRANVFHTTANYFRFRQMHRNFNPCHPHFQLRHTMSASSKNSVFFANKGKIWCANPQLDTVDCVMELRKPHSGSDVWPMERVSALTAGDGMLVIGGYDGNYALKSLSSGIDSPHSLGTLTPQERITHEGIGYTNHVCTFLDRRSGLPHAVFSSNDNYVRTLDCYSNRLIRAHNYGWAVNCTATSPDGRLRAIVGDTCSPWIVDAEKGDKIVRLANHTDFGFACAWSPDGRHVATGNQDRIVQIWDSRAWKQPLEVLSTELAGVRCMQFSPLGGGIPVLLLAESADFVSVVDAQTFQSRQQFDFFGEIGGVSFIPDGSKFFVANTDEHFGGILEFDQVGEYWGYRRGRKGPLRERVWEKGDEESSEDGAELTNMDSTSTRAHGKRCGFELEDLIV